MDLLESRRIEYESLKIIKCISSGSDGAIWEVEWNGGRFAMKQIHKARDKKYDEEKVAMMLKLKHPNIIELLYVLRDYR